MAVTVPRSSYLHSTHGRFLVRRGSRNISLTTAEVADRTRRISASSPALVPIGAGYQLLYEVVRFEVTLQLCDARGETAVLQRDQELRLVQDGVVGLYHQAWGDGQLFDDYQVEPGVVADRFQSGSRHITLISLREVKNHGDRLRLRIRRRIKHGWTQPEEWLELAVNHRTRSLRARVVFPADRPPRRAVLIEESSGVTHEIDPSHWTRDPLGHTMLVWQRRNPVQGEKYILRWTW